jgi:hypothetical protein
VNFEKLQQRIQLYRFFHIKKKAVSSLLVGVWRASQFSRISRHAPISTIGVWMQRIFPPQTPSLYL